VTPPEYKRCTKCGETKHRSEFNRDSHKKSGLQSSCKRCQRIASRKWREKNPEKAAERNRRWHRENRERVSENNKRWNKENPDRRAELNRRWTEQNRDRAAAHAKAKRERYPQKEQARAEVRRALRQGRLVRPEYCEECGGEGRPYKDGRSPIQAHHDDYSRPLDVRWLCRDCHIATHHGERPAMAFVAPGCQ